MNQRYKIQQMTRVFQRTSNLLVLIAKELQENVTWIQFNDKKREKERISTERDFDNLILEKITEWPN